MQSMVEGFSGLSTCARLTFGSPLHHGFAAVSLAMLRIGRILGLTPSTSC